MLMISDYNRLDPDFEKRSITIADECEGDLVFHTFSWNHPVFNYQVEYEVKKVSEFDLLEEYVQNIVCSDLGMPITVPLICDILGLDEVFVMHAQGSLLRKRMLVNRGEILVPTVEGKIKYLAETKQSGLCDTRTLRFAYDPYIDGLYCERDTVDESGEILDPAFISKEGQFDGKVDAEFIERILSLQELESEGGDEPKDIGKIETATLLGTRYVMYQGFWIYNILSGAISCQIWDSVTNIRIKEIEQNIFLNPDTVHRLLKERLLDANDWKLTSKNPFKTKLFERKKTSREKGMDLSIYNDSGICCLPEFLIADEISSLLANAEKEVLILTPFLDRIRDDEIMVDTLIDIASNGIQIGVGYMSIKRDKVVADDLLGSFASENVNLQQIGTVDYFELIVDRKTVLCISNERVGYHGRGIELGSIAFRSTKPSVIDERLLVWDNQELVIV